jgi:hypothetical protein
MRDDDGHGVGPAGQRGVYVDGHVKDDPPTYTRRSPTADGDGQCERRGVLPAVFVETRDSLMLLFTNPVERGEQHGRR